MGKGFFEYKAKKGLIRVNVTVSNKIIKDIRFSGDFMLHPEDVIWELENALKGKTIDVEKLRKTVEEVFQDVVFVGSCVDDFVYVLGKAVEVASND